MIYISSMEQNAQFFFTRASGTSECGNHNSTGLLAACCKHTVVESTILGFEITKGGAFLIDLVL